MPKRLIIHWFTVISMGRLIIISNRLPFSIDHEGEKYLVWFDRDSDQDQQKGEEKVYAEPSLIIRKVFLMQIFFHPALNPITKTTLPRNHPAFH